MDRTSVSRSDLVLEIGGGSKLRVEMKRHLAPRTVGTLLRSLPFRGNAHFLGKGIVYLESGVDSGGERTRRDFKTGDVAFYPAQGSICFFTGDLSAVRPMSPVGRISSGVEALLDTRPGDVLSLYQAATG